jgi:lysozyme
MVFPASMTRRPRVALLIAAALAMALTATTATAANAVIVGPDVSSHNHAHGGVVNWGTVRGVAGSSFAFVKATEGVSYPNPYFARDFAAIRANGLVRGAYHFAKPRGSTPAAITANARTQAEFYVRTAGNMRAAGDLPPVLDLEIGGTLNAAQLSLWTQTWLTRAKQLTGRTPILYTYVHFWKSRMGNSRAFAAYPLWLAYYSTTSPPKVGGWTRETFWQYTDRAVSPGVNRPVDMNVFNGSLAQLRAMANYGAKVARAAPRPRTTAPRPRITAAFSASRIRKSTTTYLRGSTSRSLAGKKIYLERYAAGVWRVRGTTRASAAGKYSFRIRAWVSINRYRATVRTTPHVRLVSPTRTLRAHR